MSLEKKKVYILDDDESVCRSLKTLLVTFDFEVTTFNSAQSFFDAVPTNSLGCLILDIHMAGSDGWTVQKKILESGSKLSVIFISAAREDNSKRALQVGAIGFLQKPFDGQTLVDLVNTALENTNGIIK